MLLHQILLYRFNLRIALWLAMLCIYALPVTASHETTPSSFQPNGMSTEEANSGTDESTSPLMACPFVVDITDIVADCAGAPLGSFMVQASTGMPAYEYSLDGFNFQPSNAFTNLSAGMYTVTVRDADGCVVTANVNIISAIPPEVVVLSVDSASCGMNNAKVDVGSGGGIPPYTYSINAMEQPTGVFGNLGPGPHTIFIEDGNGCMNSKVVMVKDAGFPTFDTIAVSNALCGENGTVFAEVSGGVVPYMYSIGGPFQNADFFIQVEPGTYTLSVIDKLGCPLEQEIIVTDIPGPEIVDVMVNPAYCGTETGFALVSTSGGSHPLDYSLDGGPLHFLPFFTNLAPGMHTIEVFDTNDCTALIEFEITEIGGPVIDGFEVTETTCENEDGTVTILASGGFGVLMYQIENETPTANNFFTGLEAGDYLFTVYDDTECAENILVTVPESDGPRIDAIEQDATCNGSNGSLFIFATEGTEPYLFSFNGGEFTTIEEYTGLPSDFYDICVRDAQGCMDCDEVYIDGEGPPEIDSIHVGNAVCMNPGSLTIVTSEGTGNLLYSLDSITFIPDSIFSGLPAGSYSVFVVDENDCVVQDDATIIATTADAVTLTESICNGQSYQVGSSFFNATGQYVVTLTNSNGCDSIVTLNLTVATCCVIQGTAISETICAGETYVFNGTSYTVPGTYEHTLSNATSGGCDSVAVLNLQVIPLVSTSESAEICAGQSYSWNSGLYTQAGVYFDTVMSVIGCDSAIRLNLTVNALPSAAAGTDQTLLCETPTLTLTGSGTGTPSWTGPGVTNVPQFQIVVDLPGQYILTVTSADGCQATDAVVVFANPSAPTANAGPDGILTCILDSAILSGSGAGSDLMYTWFGPDIPPSLVNSPISQGNAGGIYYLIVTDTVSGCVSAPDTAIINDLGIDPLVNITNNGNIDCNQQSVLLGSTGSATGVNIVYTWIDPNGQVTPNVPSITATIPGTYFLYVNNTSTGCESVASHDVLEMIVLPLANAGPDQVLKCDINEVTLVANGGNPNSDLTYQWSGPVGGIITNPASQQVDVIAPGNYTLTILNTANGCSNTDLVTVVDLGEAPDVDAGPTQNLTCAMDEVVLDGSQSSTGPEFTYVWNGPGVNQVQGVSVEVDNAGWFYLVVTNNINECFSEDSVLVTMAPVLTGAEITVENPPCAVDGRGRIEVDDTEGGTGPFTYSIDGILFQDSPEFEGLVPGTYQVIVLDDNGCEWEETAIIEQSEILILNIGPDIEILGGDHRNLSATIDPDEATIDSISWSPAELFSCTNCLNPTITVETEADTFFVTAIVFSGDCYSTDTFLISVKGTNTVYIPNAFSPNEDLLNDYITIFTPDKDAIILLFEIYDRWGNNVFWRQNFAPNVPKLGWDGYQNGRPMNPAVFAYKADIRYGNGTTELKKGTITLLR